MFEILKKLWFPRERRKQGRVPAELKVWFRILDYKRPQISSRRLEGSVLDISANGLCIGTRVVFIDGLHVFPPGCHTNKLDIELDLDPDLPPLKAVGEVVWYRKAQDHPTGWIFKIGVSWNLSQADEEMIRTFLKNGRDDHRSVAGHQR